MPEIVIRATARREIKAHGIYLEDNGGQDVTDRFLAAVRRTLRRVITNTACRNLVRISEHADRAHAAPLARKRIRGLVDFLSAKTE